MTRTSLTGLVGVFGFSTAAALILVRRFYGAFGSISVAVPMSLWIITVSCVFIAVVVKRRREAGRIGLDRSQLNPMMVANFLLLGKACAWAGAISAGAYLGCVLYVAPKLAVLTAAAQDFPALALGAVGGVALSVAGIVLERACEVPPPPSGEQVS